MIKFQVLLIFRNYPVPLENPGFVMVVAGVDSLDRLGMIGAD